jgi:hypothetical protein
LRQFVRGLVRKLRRRRFKHNQRLVRWKFSLGWEFSLIC